jgi:SAM-dependent methyltransferase
MSDLHRKEYWNSRWKEGKTGWDLGMPSPPLLHLINTLNPGKSSRILIPGCGNAWEAEWLADQGYTNITLADIAPELCSILEHRFAQTPEITVRCVDFFDLKGPYDLILEQTFFCAILPELRERYVLKMKELLSEQGILAGVLFDTDFPFEGPPFGGHADDYRDLFQQQFQSIHFAPCRHSAPPRAGTECLMVCSQQNLNPELQF